MRRPPGFRGLALVALAGTAVLAACADTDDRPSADPRPRIVLLLSLDTLRADHLGMYGYDRFTSPVLDEVARGGVVFEDASASAPWTLPSHASMLTGLHPLRHRVVSSRTRLPDGIPTLAAMLAKYGYDTAAVVNSDWLKKENFQITRDFERYLWAPAKFDRRMPTSWVTDQAVQWISEMEDRPLFLFVHYYDLHSDYVSEPHFEKLFVRPYEGSADGTAWQLKRSVLEEDYIESCRRDFDPDRCAFGEDFVVDGTFERVHFDPADVRHLIDLYDAQIRQLDTELGRLFAAIRRRGLLEQTLLVITSDHGEEFMEHGRVEHLFTTYQPTLQIPLVIRGPGVPAGLRIDTPVSSVDIVPTILARTGATIPRDLDGLDLSPLWSEGGTDAFEDRLLFGEAAGGIHTNLFAGDYFPVFRSVRRGRYKLVYESKGEASALYDLNADPGETTDLSEREPEVAARLTAIMTARYRNFTPEPEAGSEAVIEPEDLERLRALGYVP